jgi:hypothetical protein
MNKNNFLEGLTSHAFLLLLTFTFKTFSSLWILGCIMFLSISHIVGITNSTTTTTTTNNNGKTPHLERKGGN